MGATALGGEQSGTQNLGGQAFLDIIHLGCWWLCNLVQELYGLSFVGPGWLQRIEPAGGDRLPARSFVLPPERRFATNEEHLSKTRQQRGRWRLCRVRARLSWVTGT